MRWQIIVYQTLKISGQIIVEVPFNLGKEVNAAYKIIELLYEDGGGEKT